MGSKVTGLVTWVWVLSLVGMGDETVRARGMLLSRTRRGHGARHVGVASLGDEMARAWG